LRHKSSEPLEGADAEVALKPCGEVVRTTTMKMKNTTTRKMKMIWPYELGRNVDDGRDRLSSLKA